MKMLESYWFWIVIVLVIFLTGAYFFSIIPCKKNVSNIYSDGVQLNESYLELCSLKQIIEISHENPAKITELPVLNSTGLENAS